MRPSKVDKNIKMVKKDKQNEKLNGIIVNFGQI